METFNKSVFSFFFTFFVLILFSYISQCQIRSSNGTFKACPGEIVYYDADVQSVAYEWSVSGGTILEGTYTYRIKVQWVSTGGNIIMKYALPGTGNKPDTPVSRSITSNQGIGGNISSNTTCYGYSSSLTAFGYNGIIHHWESSTNNQSWEIISSTNSTLTINQAYTTTKYRAAVTSPCGGNIVYSAEGVLTVVQDNNNGTISLLSGSNPVCYPPGNSGAIRWDKGSNSFLASTVFQWEQKEGLPDDNTSSWTPNSYKGVNDMGFNVSNKTMSYRAKIDHSVCGYVYCYYTVYVIDAVNPGNITPLSQTFCGTTTSSSLLTLNSYKGAIEWQRYDEQHPQWITIGSGSTLVPPTLSVSTRFRAKVTGGCGQIAYSPEAIINVNSFPVANIIPTGIKTICSTCFENITAADGSNYTFQWKKGSINLYNAEGHSFKAVSEGIYSVEVTSNSCTKLSNTLEIKLNKPPIVNVNGDKILDLPNNSITINGTASDIDGTIKSILWTKAEGPTTFTMTGSNTLNLTLNNLVAGMYTFRLTVSDEYESTYDEVSIVVNAIPNNYNWVKVSNVLVANQTTITQVNALSIDSKNNSWNYFDGLGRPMQTVSKQGSPNKNDIVQPIIYDAFGREITKYLPYISNETNGYFKSNPIGTTTENYTSSPQYLFYNNINDQIVNDSKPYSVSVFEESPLNRILKTGAPGVIWQPTSTIYSASTDQSIKSDYDLNIANEVIKWSYVLPSAAAPLGLVNANSGSTPNYYEANQLYKNKTKDEHQNEVIEYKDKEGKIILKKVPVLVSSGNVPEYAQTYYIYDDLNNLVCVLPPEAIRGVLRSPTSDYFNKSDSEKNAFLKRWAFRYKYDSRKRMIEKQVPGAGPVQMFYDPWDRMVYTQDSVQRSNTPKQYTYTKYDVLNRPIITGIWTSTQTKDQITADLNALTAVKRFENISSTTHGYTLTTTAPINAIAANVLSVTYYDDYRFLSQSWFEETPNRKYIFHKAKTGYAGENNTRVKGQITATKIKTLRGNNWLNSVIYYDDKYRTIRTIAENQVGGADTVSISYDFVGKVLSSKSEHTGIIPITVLKRYEYDHAGRLLKLYNQVDANPEILLAQNKYNELGQLIDKGIGVKNNVPVQSMDYRYNIRGWLTNINKSDLTKDTNGDKNDDDGDLFGMELMYEQSAP